MIVGPQIVKDGLVLHLDAGAERSYTSGDTAWSDLSDNQVWTASLADTPTFQTDGGGCFLFNGTTQDAPVSGFTQSEFGTSGTHILWLKHTNTLSGSGTNNTRPFGYEGNFETRWGGTTAENNVRLSLDYGGSGTLVGVKNVWWNTEWYQVAITHTPTTTAIYVDGELDNTGGFTGIGTPTLLKIAAGGASAFFNGKISIFMVYNRELSAEEIQQDFNAHRRRFGK